MNNNVLNDNVWTTSNYDFSNYLCNNTESNDINDCMSSMKCPSPSWTEPVAAIRPVVMDRPVSNKNSVMPVRPKASTRRVKKTYVNDDVSNTTKLLEVNSIIEKNKTKNVGDLCRPSKEYKMCKNNYMKASYSGNLETQVFYGRVSTGQQSFRYDYLNIFDILKYVTCGGVLSDSYKDSFLDYIEVELKRNLIDVKKYTENISKIDGGVYKRELPLIAWCDYALTAKLCLEWVLCNPEKLGRC